MSAKLILAAIAVLVAMLAGAGAPAVAQSAQRLAWRSQTEPTSARVHAEKRGAESRAWCGERLARDDVAHEHDNGPFRYHAIYALPAGGVDRFTPDRARAAGRCAGGLGAARAAVRARDPVRHGDALRAELPRHLGHPVAADGGPVGGRRASGRVGVHRADVLRAGGGRLRHAAAHRPGGARGGGAAHELHRLARHARRRRRVRHRGDADRHPARPGEREQPRREARGHACAAAIGSATRTRCATRSAIPWAR